VVRGIADSSNSYRHKIFRARILLQAHLNLNQIRLIGSMIAAHFQKNILLIFCLSTGLRDTLKYCRFDSIMHVFNPYSIR
jgi:hypothetical protein